jgi:hypothetical protein
VPYVAPLKYHQSRGILFGCFPQDDLLVEVQKASWRFRQLPPLRAPAAFDQWLRQATRKKWVIYAKWPFTGPEVVLAYLAATRIGSASPTTASSP